MDFVGRPWITYSPVPVKYLIFQMDALFHMALKCLDVHVYAAEMSFEASLEAVSLSYKPCEI